MQKVRVPLFLVGFAAAVPVGLAWSCCVAAQREVDQRAPSPLWVVHHKAAVVTVAFSLDGKILAGGSGYNGIIFWNPATRQEIRRIEGKDVGDFIVFSPDARLLASARNWQFHKTEGVIQLWDVATGKLMREIKGHHTLVRCLAYSPDGKFLASHAQHDTVRVWEMATGKEVVKIRTNSAGHAVAFSPDGNLLAFDHDYTIRLCEATTGKERRKLEGHQEVTNARGRFAGIINALTFSPDGKMLASASCDNMARIWDVSAGKTLHVLEGHEGFVNATAFFPHGKLLATGGEDGTIRVWDVATGRQLRVVQAHEMQRGQNNAIHLIDERKDVFWLAFSPDGRTLASGGRDGAVKIWEVASLLK